MNLVVIAACFAVCQGAKLNRGYLPPESAKTAGGDGDILQTPFRSQEPLQDKSLPTRLPVGSYVNEFEGVVIDADSAGTRATHSGLGNPRETYGSTDSKVGEAAFRESILNANKGVNKQGGQNVPPNVNANNAKNKQHGHVLPNVAGVRQPLLQPGGHQIPVLEAERFHASRDRASNIINYQNDIGITDFNYAFQTDNGISAAEIGMAMDGVKSKGGYSYTGDDGQVYTISYTADEAGYRPQGSHIPTPPPIPAEILKALEQNAKDEAAGIVDDGSYDAKKYNTDRTKGNKPDNKHNTFERRPAFNTNSDSG
ncbi:cuticle protein 2-like [Aricia agestis]|uniref:cuticle protein 2-like n=1 Tax=Aricia agestis TaxID=91739 RepID=UPI001C2089DF|nr:cuticle protein 2-like [Aricia agestis]